MAKMLRVTDEVYAWIKEAAEREHRSITMTAHIMLVAAHRRDLHSIDDMLETPSETDS